METSPILQSQTEKPPENKRQQELLSLSHGYLILVYSQITRGTILISENAVLCIHCLDLANLDTNDDIERQ